MAFTQSNQKLTMTCSNVVVTKMLNFIFMKLYNSPFLLFVVLAAIQMNVGCNNSAGNSTTGSGDTSSTTVDTPSSGKSAAPTALLSSCSLYRQLDSEKTRFQFCGNLHNKHCIYSFATSDTPGWARPMKDVFFGPKDKILSFDEKIKLQDLVTIYQQIKSDTNNYKPNSSDVAALKMTYGLNKTNDRLVIIYSPLIVKNILLTNISNAGADVQQIRSYNSLYEVKNKKWIITMQPTGYSFIPKTDAEAEEYEKNFRDSIEIKDPPEANNGRHFRNTDDFKYGDIKSTFMSFQQLFRMYCDNSNSIVKMDDYLTIYPVAGKFKHTGFKLHIVVSKGPLKDDTALKNQTTSDFQLLAADASQMCPPKCENAAEKKTADAEIAKDLPN